MCRKCGQTKPLESFPFHYRSKNQRSTRCCACTAAYLAEYHASRTPPSMAPEAIAERTRAWRAAHAGARRAHKCVEVALASGLLQRQPCKRCGASTADAHHPNYNEPLRVVWLCRACHQHVHAEERYAAACRTEKRRPVAAARPAKTLKPAAKAPPVVEAEPPWREAIRRRIEARQSGVRP